MPIVSHIPPQPSLSPSDALPPLAQVCWLACLCRDLSPRPLPGKARIKAKQKEPCAGGSQHNPDPGEASVNRSDACRGSTSRCFPRGAARAEPSQPGRGESAWHQLPELPSAHGEVWRQLCSKLVRAPEGEEGPETCSLLNQRKTAPACSSSALSCSLSSESNLQKCWRPGEETQTPSFPLCHC